MFRINGDHDIGKSYKYYSVIDILSYYFKKIILIYQVSNLMAPVSIPLTLISFCNLFNKDLTPSESLDRHPCSSRNSDASRSGGILFSNFMSLGFQGLSVVNTLSPNRQGKLNEEHPLM